MGYRCGWCGREDVGRRVSVNLTSASVEAYRYFCDAAHQANWETNQPRPKGAYTDVNSGSGVDDIVHAANSRGWFLLHTYQLKPNPTPNWVVSLLKRKPDGGTTAHFTEYAEAATLKEALYAAYMNAVERDKFLGGGKKTAARKPLLVEDGDTGNASDPILDGVDDVLSWALIDALNLNRAARERAARAAKGGASWGRKP